MFVAILLPAAKASKFNSQRKGFILGGGLGFAPVASLSVNESYIEADDSKAGVGLNFIVGYAWDEHNMIVYEGNVAGYSVEIWGDDEAVSQGFNGASWYHYFGPVGKSAFTVAGLGLYYFKVGDYDANDASGALLLGGGYEFARHWQFGGYLSVGKTSTEGVDFNHSHFSILISTVAF